MRLALAAVAGGIVIFVWGAIAHVVLPVGAMGLKVLPNEQVVLDGLKGQVPEAGLYLFPGLDPGQEWTPEQESAWQARYESGPAGLLAYRPQGGQPMSPAQLGKELAADVLAAFLAALLAGSLAGSYARRAALLTGLGAFAWSSVNLSYCIWYGFPFAFVAGEAIDLVVGALLAGLVIARIVPAARPAP